MRHGKSTLAALLLENIWAIAKAQGSDVPVQRVSMAGKLKESAAALIGITPEVLDGVKGFDMAHGGITITLPGQTVCLTFREFLQRYGDEAHRRVFGEDFWVRALPPMPGVSIIDDIRYPNELAVVDTHIAIVRPGKWGDDGHPSEAHAAAFWEGSDIQVNNNGTIEDLATAANGIAQIILYEMKVLRA
jgi:hypothetical protein